MSDNQTNSSRYFIPVALIALSLLTSVLFSQIFFQPGSDSELDSATDDRSPASSEPVVAEESPVEDSGPETSPVADESAPVDQPVAQAGSESDAAETVEQESSDSPVITDLTVLVPANDALCDGQTPWREGDRRLSETTGLPGCYGVRFELAKSATVLLLKLSDGAAPRSMLAEGCRPFGFNSARFEPGKAQQLPRGVDAQPGVFQAGSAPASTRFVLIAAEQGQEPLASLESGVANLCGQSATLTSEQVQGQLDELAQLGDVSVKTVQGEL